MGDWPVCTKVLSQTKEIRKAEVIHSNTYRQVDNSKNGTEENSRGRGESKQYILSWEQTWNVMDLQ